MLPRLRRLVSEIAAKLCWKTSPSYRRQDDFRRYGLQTGKRKDRDLGRAKKITIDKDNTTIIDGAGKKADLEGRVKQSALRLRIRFRL